jgi:hypothetical protein
MTEDTTQGNFLGTGNHTSGGAGSGFGDGIDNQISNLENQLQNAQKTLIELQILKERLEEQKRINQERADILKEKQSIEKLKDENQELKKELSTYHGEIKSLKKVISSLKEDLSASAQLFQTKVANSLKFLEEADESLKDDFKSSHNEAPAKHEKDNDETKEEKAHIKEPQDEPKKAEPIAAETHKPKETKTVVKEDEANDEEAAGEDHPHIDGKHHHRHQDFFKLEQKPEESESEVLEEEFQEYQKIKKELEDLEKGSLFHLTEPAPEVAPVVAPVVTSAPAPAAAAPEAVPTSTPAAAPVAAPAAAAPNAEPPKQADTPNPQAAPAPAVQPTPTPTTPAPPSPEATPSPTPASVAAAPAPQANPLDSIAGANQATPAVGAPAQPKKKWSLFAKKEKAQTDTGDNKKKGFSLFKKKEKTEAQPAPAATPTDAEKGSGNGMVVKAATIFLILCAGAVGYQVKNAENLRSTFVSQVKSAYEQKPDLSNVDPVYNPDRTMSDQYPTAFAEVSFENTVWDKFVDPEYGVRIDYPKNTSHRLRPIGSDNVWFLRKDGYLLKLEKSSDTDFVTYLTNHPSAITYKSEAVKFKGLDSLHLVATEPTPVQGETYLVKSGQFVYKVWYKTYLPGENPDDEKRVAKMLETLQFISQ